MIKGRILEIYVHIRTYIYTYQVSSCWVYCICISSYVVPVRSHVRITISEYQPFDSEASGDVNSGESGERNVTIGSPLTLECTIRVRVRDTSRPVDIIWITGGKVIRRVDNITTRSYTDVYEISSLSAIDNGRKYQCLLGIYHINETQPVYVRDQFRLSFFGE